MVFAQVSSQRFPGWWGRSLRFTLGLLLALALANAGWLALSTQAAETQLNLSTRATPATFNCALNAVFPNVCLFTAEGLTRENGVTGAIEPGLAESWQSSSDHKRWVFTLRRGLKWSDGQPLTADDVLFTYREIVANPAIPTDWRDVLKIGVSKALPTLRKLNDRQIEFTLPEPFAPFLNATSAITILPRHALIQAVQTQGIDGQPQFLSTWDVQTDPARIVVNGPYKLERYLPDRLVVFQRNPHYWQKDAAGHALPGIDRIYWHINRDLKAELQQFLAGKLDVLGDLRPLTADDMARLKPAAAQGKFQIYSGGPRANTRFLTFNLTQGQNTNGKPLVDPVKSAWFNTQEFRQAVAYAIDRPQMLRAILGGLGTLQNSPIPVQSPYFLQQGLKIYDYQPDRARQLLQQAGFHLNSAGKLLDKQGNPVRFTLLTNAEDSRRLQMGTQIKQNLQNLGMQVDLVSLSFNALVDRVFNSRDWDALLLGFTAAAEPHYSSNLWMSDGSTHLFNLKPADGQPLSDWQTAAWERQIDQLFQAGAEEIDVNRRKQIYAQFQQLVQEQLPLIHLVGEQAFMAVQSRVQGIKFSGLADWGLWNIPALTIQPVSSQSSDQSVNQLSNQSASQSFGQFSNQSSSQLSDRLSNQLLSRSTQTPLTETDALAQIEQLPEVQQKSQALARSQPPIPLGMMVVKQPTASQPDYTIQVYESHPDHLVTLWYFQVAQRTGTIAVQDSVTGQWIPLPQWRRSR